MSALGHYPQDRIGGRFGVSIEDCAPNLFNNPQPDLPGMEIPPLYPLSPLSPSAPPALPGHTQRGGGSTPKSPHGPRAAHPTEPNC